MQKGFEMQRQCGILMNLITSDQAITVLFLKPGLLTLDNDENILNSSLATYHVLKINTLIYNALEDSILRIQNICTTENKNTQKLSASQLNFCTMTE